MVVRRPPAQRQRSPGEDNGVLPPVNGGAVDDVDMVLVVLALADAVTDESDVSRGLGPPSFEGEIEANAGEEDGDIDEDVGSDD